jgi:hypothetical protein
MVIEDYSGEQVPDFLAKLARDVGGTITEVSRPLPDGSGFAVMTTPLPKTHWIYKQPGDEFNVPPMPFKMASGEVAMVMIGKQDDSGDAGLSAGIGKTMTKREFADVIQEAARYAIKCATMDGTEADFSPDAMVQNLQVGLLGYWTATGLSQDEWANPKP